MALCEPLDLDALTSLVGAGAVEQAETQGLPLAPDRKVGLEVVEVRFNHLLLADVMRRRLGVAAARRLRGELVRALRDKPVRGPGERIRLAELTLDSDVAPDVDLLVAAAEDAISLTDIILGERLARAAVDRGAGLEARELLARCLLWQGKATEADDAFGAVNPDAMDEAELLGWATVRVLNLQALKAIPRPPNRSSSCCVRGSTAPNCGAAWTRWRRRRRRLPAG